MITPQPGQANQMRSSAGSCSSGHHCSKHFPLDVGFLLCLAATQGCLNFSQRQIFIHQSVQCSTGQAWEGEGDLRAFSPRRMRLFSPFLPTEAGEVGPLQRSSERRQRAALQSVCTWSPGSCVPRRAALLRRSCLLL